MAATKFTYPAHPAAAVLPVMPREQFDALVEDIRAHGLKEKIVLWNDGEKVWLLDGRHRDIALQRLQLPIEPHTVVLSRDDVSEPAAFVISKNIRRRHLTKGEQAKAIWQIAQAIQRTESANMAASVPRDEQGRVQGSTKDPVKATAVELAKPLDISERTMERTRPKEATTPEVPPRAKVRKPTKPTLTEPAEVTSTLPLPAATGSLPNQDDMRTELRKVLEVSRGRWTKAKQVSLKSTMPSLTAALRTRDDLVEWLLAELARISTTSPAPPADDAMSPPFELVARYQCPECDTVLDEDERRCSDCNKFGRRIEGIVCPKCSEFVSEDEL